MDVHAYLKVVNDFIEDTAVVVATPYLLGRGSTLAVVFRERIRRRDSVRIGLIFGMVAFTEIVFPEERYPYLTDTLTTGFAAFTGGPLVGMTCATIVALGAFALQPWPSAVLRAVSVLVTGGVCLLFRGARGGSRMPIMAALAGACSQLAVVLLNRVAAQHPIDRHALGAVFGNGLGMFLTTIVFREAWVRMGSERNRAAAEQSRALAGASQLAATEARLAALRARVHPHFLYNALNAISALCGTSPEDAQEATAQLGELMRRTLDTRAGTCVALANEIECAKIYLDIEQRRFGSRLTVLWSVEPECLSVGVPPFSIQTLVENAVRHGASAVTRPVTISVTVRRMRDRVIVAVRDDGRGLEDCSAQRSALTDEHSAHGLQLLAGQLANAFGKSARLRLFGSHGRGALALFAAPNRHETG